MERNTLFSIADIKAAVDAGKDVRCGSDSYKVIRDSIGQYLIVCSFNDYCIGLHGREGTEYADKLNGRDFYVYGN